MWIEMSVCLQPEEVDLFLPWVQSDLPEELGSIQVMDVLDSRLSMQDEQMQKIQQELEQVAQNPQALNTRLNQLQVTILVNISCS